MKNSDQNTIIAKLASKVSLVAVMLFAFVSGAFAQEPYHFIEGSTHKFGVAYHEGNSYQWDMYYDPYIDDIMESTAYDLNGTGTSNNAEVTFNNMSRAAAELVYLVVTEGSQNGCSTRRSIQIMLEPNNMYFDFAELSVAECFQENELYEASVQLGMNFNVRETANVPIDSIRFPINVEYTIQNMTVPNSSVVNGNPVAIQYQADGQYKIAIPEAIGVENTTTEFELTITKVTDKYETEIIHEEDRRIQIRIFNHLPHSTGMDMALAYVGIEYVGERN